MQVVDILHKPAHDTIRHAQLLCHCICHHSWNDGMVGTLVWGQAVWMSLFQHKVRASVLQCKSTSFGHNACAKSHVV